MPNVLITGAAGGIGRALVARFKSAGYAVIATDIVECPDDLVCDHYLSIDLERTVEDEAYAVVQFAAIVDCMNGAGLKALINNAAIQILGSVDSLTRQEWRKTMDINLFAPFFWTQSLLPQLEKASGSVVNISSIHAHLTKQNFVAYATSKAALSGMTRAMAVDVGARIRINAIEPGAIGTELLVKGFAGNSEGFSRLEECHPQNRIGSPKEIAELSYILINEELRFIHGSCISINGGIGGKLHDPV